MKDERVKTLPDGRPFPLETLRALRKIRKKGLPEPKMFCYVCGAILDNNKYAVNILGGNFRCEGCFPGSILWRRHIPKTTINYYLFKEEQDGRRRDQDNDKQDGRIHDDRGNGLRRECLHEGHGGTPEVSQSQHNKPESKNGSGKESRKGKREEVTDGKGDKDNKEPSGAREV